MKNRPCCSRRRRAMRVFGSADKLASWAGMCPGNNESAGKHARGAVARARSGLSSGLVESAYASPRTKDTYLAAQFWRLTGRRGRPQAAVAVGHSILVVAYRVLDRHEPYTDLGGDYLVSRLSRTFAVATMKRSQGSAASAAGSPRRPQTSTVTGTSSADSGSASNPWTADKVAGLMPAARARASVSAGVTPQPKWLLDLELV